MTARYWIGFAMIAACLSPAFAGQGGLIVFCAPGYPGNTEQAQPTMDEFAAATAEAAGLAAGSLRAEYHEKADAGLERLGSDETALALVTLPFYLEYGEELGLIPRLSGVQSGSSTETWSLAVPRGTVSVPADLAGWELTGVPGYSPSFVRGPLLSGWGELPAELNISFTPRALSALRRASSGEKIAVLLDPAQAGALSSLPFGAKLEIATRSPEVPVSLLCTIASSSPAVDESILDALASLHQSMKGASSLEAIRLEKFMPVDIEDLERVRMAFNAAGGPAEKR